MMSLLRVIGGGIFLQRTLHTLETSMLIFLLSSALRHLDGNKGGMKAWLLRLLGTLAGMHRSEFSTRGCVYTIHQQVYTLSHQGLTIKLPNLLH